MVAILAGRGKQSLDSPTVVPVDNTLVAAWVPIEKMEFETGCGLVSGVANGVMNTIGDLLAPDASDIDTSTICTEGSEVVEQTLRILEQELSIDARVHGS